MILISQLTLKFIDRLFLNYKLNLSVTKFNETQDLFWFKSLKGISYVKLNFDRPLIVMHLV
jgi:hypothetical protein